MKDEVDKPVKVHESIGATIPLGDNYSFIRIDLGHEQWSPSGRPKDIEATMRRIQEQNEELLDKRIKQLRKQLRKAK